MDAGFGRSVSAPLTKNSAVGAGYLRAGEIRSSTLLFMEIGRANNFALGCLFCVGAEGSYGDLFEYEDEHCAN